MPQEKGSKSDSSFQGSSDSDSEGEEKKFPSVSTKSNYASSSSGIKKIITASAVLKEIPSRSSSAALKRKKDEIDESGDKKPKRKVYKKNTKSSWPNIFAQSKAIVTILKKSVPDSPSPGITINFCDSDFLSTFGYVECGPGLLLNSMMGKASSVATSLKFETMLRLGRTATEYINLYRSDGVTPLSCHISLLPLKSHCNMPSSTEPSSSSDAASSDSLLWGVITVRSASAVGNARFSGLSFLGMDRVSDEIRQGYYNNKIVGVDKDKDANDSRRAAECQDKEISFADSVHLNSKYSEGDEACV